MLSVENLRLTRLLSSPCGRMNINQEWNHAQPAKHLSRRTMDAMYEPIILKFLVNFIIAHDLR